MYISIVYDIFTNRIISQTYENLNFIIAKKIKILLKKLNNQMNLTPKIHKGKYSYQDCSNIY